MGFFRAVVTVYARMFNFSGRARRAEFWWFMLFTFLASMALQVAAVLMLGMPVQAALSDAAAVEALARQQEALLVAYGPAILLATVFLYWLPYLAVMVRRLHDTGRRGWWLLKPMALSLGAMLALGALVMGGGALTLLALPLALVPIGAAIWQIVVLCLPGEEGDNRFGPDPIPDRYTARHPAMLRRVDPGLRRDLDAVRKAEFEAYYRDRVLPAIRQSKQAREG